MRRKDREVTDWNDIIQILNKCGVIRLGLVDNGIPYIVPLNFGVEYTNEQLVLFFHSALYGKKIDILKKNPYVCFEADCSFQVIKSKEPCKWSVEYESIIGYGTISFISDIDDKKAAMDCIMKKYGYQEMLNYIPEVFSKTILYKLSVEEMTGKRNIKN